MSRYKWHIILGISLVALSALAYVAQVALFHKPGDTLFYLLQDLAFVPVQVLLVTIILSELLAERERTHIRHKMNMVIGAFFSEMGNDLLERMIGFDTTIDEMRPMVLVGHDLNSRKLAAARAFIQQRTCAMDSRRPEMAELKPFLSSKRQFLLGLLENSNLLEHERFTELLWAICHLTEELEHRKDLSMLPEADSAHLSKDMARAYVALVSEWLSYAKHLKDHYPYMFSLVLRTNPFDPEARAEVR